MSALERARALARRLRWAVGNEVWRYRALYQDLGVIAAALERLDARLDRLEKRGGGEGAGGGAAGGAGGGDVDGGARLGSRVCGAADFRTKSFASWCEVFRERPRLHRKLWEHWYIAQALAERGMLEPGRRGIGFGVGREVLPAVFAARGVDVIATDQAGDSAAVAGWADSSQWSARIDDLRRDDICARELFERRVTFRAVDMNALPRDIDGTADFVWSACSLEHLGSIAHGARFIERSLEVLRAAGGVAVHTTELNLSSNDATLDNAGTVLFRRRDIDELMERLARAGHDVAPLTIPAAAGVADGFVDVPPYREEPHLRLRLSGFVTTSIGLIITRR